MSRRVRRRVTRKGKEKADWPEIDERFAFDGEKGTLDWTRLPDDALLQIFSCLNHRDRASLSSTCKAWWALGRSPCLWQALDLGSHKFDSTHASSLASRCVNLEKLRFRGQESADAVINLHARNLRHLSGDYCRKMTDSTLCILAARHEALESIQIGPDFCERISSDAIKAVAICCPNLQKLRLSGLNEVDAIAINALAKHCLKLTDIGFVDCVEVDETALGNVTSVHFISIAGTPGVEWALALQNWTKLPNLVGLDVSRTDMSNGTLLKLFSSLPNLKVLCALNCEGVVADATLKSKFNRKGKVLLSDFTDILQSLATIFVDMPENKWNVFLHWRDSKAKDKKLDELFDWLEWALSSSLLRISEDNLPGLDAFWLNQGTNLLLSFMKSADEEVQERAALALATYVVIDDENASIDTGRAQAVMREGGIEILLNLARSWREGLQSEAAKAIAYSSVNGNVAKAVADEGGIEVLINLAKSVSKSVAEEAAGGLWNLSIGDEHKGAIAEAGGVKALVDLIIKWSGHSNGDGVLERGAGALANLAADEKCSTEIASVGGIQTIVMLVKTRMVAGIQEQAARALANLAAHGDSNGNNAAIGREAGAIGTLVQLTSSTNNGVRQEAAGALWNLSFDDTNREAISAAHGVKALVDLANTCLNAPRGLQERAAGALWGLSASEANSIAIGREGGVTPLIEFAQSNAEDVHETAVGALWNLAFNPGNALRIVEENGVSVLAHLCSSSISKMARFMSALALSYIFDGRMDEVALARTSTEGSSKGVNIDKARRMALQHIEGFVMSFSDPQTFSAASASSAPTALAQIAESSRIQEAGQLKCRNLSLSLSLSPPLSVCMYIYLVSLSIFVSFFLFAYIFLCFFNSGAEIGKFVSMLRNPSPILKSCAAFALIQFTIPGGRHATHHANILQDAGAGRVLRVAAASASGPLEAKIFARIVLRNLELNQTESHL